MTSSLFNNRSRSCPFSLKLILLLFKCFLTFSVIEFLSDTNTFIPSFLANFAEPNPLIPDPNIVMSLVFII